MYFVTICTRDSKNSFGKIVGLPHVETPCMAVDTQGMASLQPTEIGAVAYSEWIKTPGLRLDMNLKLGEFVVMPNPIHGTILLAQTDIMCHHVDTPYMRLYE